MILDGIKAIFIPDMEEMKKEFSSFAEQLRPNVDTLDSSVHLEGWNEREPGNISSPINLGNSVVKLNFDNMVFMDLEFFKQVVLFFRPVINGFLTLGLGWLWYREVMSFIGQVSPLAAGEGRRIEAEERREAAKAERAARRKE